MKGKDKRIYHGALDKCSLEQSISDEKVITFIVKEISEPIHQVLVGLTTSQQADKIQVI